MPTFAYRKSPTHELVPNFALDAIDHDQQQERCFNDDRVIQINFGNAGLTDRTGKIVLLSSLACHLDAKIVVPAPCNALTPSHNNHGSVSCDKSWDDYVEFTIHRKQKRSKNWFKCSDSILGNTKSVETLPKTRIKQLTPDMLNFKYNTKTPFHWILDMSAYDMAKVWKLVNKTLPHECNAERSFGKGVVRHASKAMERHFNNTTFLGLKIRRGDDVKRTMRCSDPSIIVKFMQKLGFNNTDVFVMMEQDDSYKNTLVDTVPNRLFFENDVLQHTNTDNYDRYIQAYYVLEHAPLGRIEIRRLETTDREYDKKHNTCSLRYFPPTNSNFLNSGFSTKFIDYNDIY